MGSTCCAPADAGLSAPTKEFLTMMRSNPNLSKFGQTSETVTRLRSAATSSVFGGSVFRGVGASTRKPNSLEDDVREFDRGMDVMQGGGYYVLHNIRAATDTQECLDIYLLIDRIQDRELLQKIKTIHEITAQETHTLGVTMDKASTQLRTRD